MASATKWSNIGIAVQSALAAADTITAITKANPGVATSTAHGLVDGDLVVLTVQGMYQIDGRVVRVANKTNDTFELEGVDTTLMDTFTSGTAELITFGTTLSTATSVSASGGDFDFIDVTTIHDNVKKQIPGLANPATFTFENIWDVADSGLSALKTASDNQAKRAIRFTFANGQKLYFTGYIGATLSPTGSAQQVVTTPVVITAFGRPNTYAT
jgi:hypothetical protein